MTGGDLVKDKSSLWAIAGIAVSFLCLTGYAALKLSETGNEENVIIISGNMSKSDEASTENTTEITSEISESEISTTEPLSTEEQTTEKLWVNINTADIVELVELDGIGEAIAAEIVEYRRINGDFRNIEELMNVQGIGEAKFSEIKNYIYVENPIYTEITEPEWESESISEEMIEIQTTETVTSAVESEISLEELAPININTATVEELMLLPYVTEEIAVSIIELRETIGGYSHPYELLYIEELEQNQVAEMIEFVTVVQ